MKINLPQRELISFLFPFLFILCSSPPMPTEWIISTLPQRTHYTQLLLTVCIPISIDIPDLVFPLVSSTSSLENSHSHFSFHSICYICGIWWMERHYHFRWDSIYSENSKFEISLLCSDWVCNYWKSHSIFLWNRDFFQLASIFLF